MANKTKKLKKQSVKVTYSIDKKVSDLIDDYSQKSLIPKTRVIEEAVKSYIKRGRK